MRIPGTTQNIVRDDRNGVAPSAMDFEEVDETLRMMNKHAQK